MKPRCAGYDGDGGDGGVGRRGPRVQPVGPIQDVEMAPVAHEGEDSTRQQMLQHNQYQSKYDSLYGLYDGESDIRCA